jgi:5-dehydro-2-deoxygluconokinase
VGRSLWAEPSRRWLANEIDDDALVDGVLRNFGELVQGWHARHETRKVE